MALGHSPAIQQRNNLKVYIDGLNNRCWNATSNMIDPSTWKLGSTSIVGFGSNGSLSENSRVYGLNPFGYTDLLWEAVPDGNNNADGGWNTTAFPIDHTKTYRFSVWINRTVQSTNGSFYFGLNGYGSTNGVYNISSGALSTNPYFTSGGATTLPQNEWILLVGFVLPSNTLVGTTVSEAGRYNTAGTKLASITSFFWHPNTTTAQHRTYLYYTTTTEPRQRWWQPRVDLVDGTEPSIAELIQGTPYKTKDLANGSGTGFLINGVKVTDPTTFEFDGEDDCILISPGANVHDTSYTCMAWIKRNVTGANHGILCDLAYGWWSFYITSADKLFHRHWYYDGVTYTLNSITSSASIGTEWTHVCVVFDRFSGKKLFINGQLDTTTTGQTLHCTLTSRNASYVGQARLGAPANDNTMNGKISRLMYYDTVLSDSEVQANFEAHRGQYGV